MQFKNYSAILFFIFLSGAFINNTAAANKVSDPISIPLAISPSILGPNSKAVITLDGSKMPYNVPFKIECSVNTVQNNDAIFFLPQTSNDEIDGAMLDGVQSSSSSSVLILQSGQHTVSFEYCHYLKQNPTPSLPREEYIFNGSADTVTLSNCVAGEAIDKFCD